MYCNLVVAPGPALIRLRVPGLWSDEVVDSHGDAPCPICRTSLRKKDLFDTVSEEMARANELLRQGVGRDHGSKVSALMSELVSGAERRVLLDSSGQRRAVSGLWLCTSQGGDVFTQRFITVRMRDHGGLWHTILMEDSSSYLSMCTNNNPFRKCINMDH